MGEASSLALLPKLKYEHIHLTSFTKIRVDLAAHVHYVKITNKSTLGYYRGYYYKGFE